MQTRILEAKLQRIRPYLKEERGASLVVGLLFFLICAVIAAIVIYAATVNAQRTNKTVTDEQAYQTLSSAAQAIRTEIVGGMTYTNGSVTLERLPNLKNALQGLADKAANDNAGSKSSVAFEVKTDSTHNSSMGTVKATMTMDNKSARYPYTIRILLTLPDARYTSYQGGLELDLAPTAQAENSYKWNISGATIYPVSAISPTPTPSGG